MSNYLKKLLLFGAVASWSVFSNNADASGSTVVTVNSDYFVLEFSTPSIAFSDSSQEREFHQEAKADFEKLAAVLKPAIESVLKNLIRHQRNIRMHQYSTELPSQIFPEDSPFCKNNPCQIAMRFGGGSITLRIAFFSSPSNKMLEKLHAGIQAALDKENN